MRVLLIAESANPEWASVPLVGWSHAKALSKVVRAHIVTQVRNREAFLRAGLVENRDFTALDSEKWAAPFHKTARVFTKGGKAWTVGTAMQILPYYYFEHLLWKTFRKRIEEGEFDLVHRITPLTPTYPSPLAKKCRRAGVPFLLGPLNGGLPWPRQFRSAMKKEREYLALVRGLHKLFPGYRSTRKHAAAILIASSATWAQTPGKYHHKCVYIPENGIDPSRFEKREKPPPSLPLKVLFLGRLVPYKGADMLIEALSDLLAGSRATLDILGEGPEKDTLQELVRSRNLEGAVRFHGWVDHDRVQEFLARADILGFPSIREFGGGAALEAMALGVVPVIVNYGGPAELVTPGTGFLVELGTREEIIHRMKRVFHEIARDPGVLVEKSKRGVERAWTKFTWEAKARQVLQVYEWVLGKRKEKPWFGMPFLDGTPGNPAPGDTSPSSPSQ